MENSEAITELLIELLRSNDCYGDYGVEIPEELSARLDIGIDLARRICEALSIPEGV